MIVKPKSWLYLAPVVIILAILIIAQISTVDVLIILNFLIGIVTVLSAKISLLSLWSLVSNYTYLNVVHYYFTGNGYGLLALTGQSNLHILEMSKYSLILNLSLLFWSMFTMFSSREDGLLKAYNFEVLEKNNSQQFINFACLVAIVCSIIEFPRLPFTSAAGGRFATLLPGTGWNHLALTAMLFLLPSLKYSKQVRWTYVFVIFWFLSHGERVDMIGFIILLLFLYLKNHKVTIGTLIKSISFALVLFLAFSYVGEVRGGKGADGVTLGALFEKLVEQNTASDLGYIFNISCDYIKKYPMTYGKLLIVYLEQIIPNLSVSGVSNCPDILSAKYAYPGGAYILTEPLLDFGVWGVLIVPNMYIGLIYMFLKNKKPYKLYVYIFLVATVLRYFWYGIEYIETALIWFIPFFYYLYHKRVKVKFS